MIDIVYSKTELGHQEIQARRLRLHPRLRTLLVLIDGKHRAGELLATLEGLGVSEASFAELEGHGLIAALNATAKAPQGTSEAAPLPAQTPTATDSISPATSPQAPAERAPAEEPVPDIPAAPEVELPLALPIGGLLDETVSPEDARERLRALYSFFNETIRDVLGLRGFMLQLQVEKAESLADYDAIRDAFLAAVRKAKGEALADELKLRIDELLGEPR